MNRITLFICILCFIIYADRVYNQNKKANKLYEQGKYEEALEIYHDALLESPENKKLSMNKGSAYYRLEKYDKAQENYERSLSVEDQDAKAELLYNMGNTLNSWGDRLASSGSPEAMEKYKAARDSYIQSLDIDPDDMDSKWNLQLTQMKIKEMEKQQQQNKDNKDNKDKKNQDNKQKDKQNQNKDKKDQKKDQQSEKNKQEKEKQEKDKEQQQQQGQQKQEEEKKKSEEKPEPRPEKSKEDMKKEEAMRLLMQYADDADELNKPKKKAAVIKGKKSEKDW